jgi:hypothetical protein
LVDIWNEIAYILRRPIIWALTTQKNEKTNQHLDQTPLWQGDYLLKIL